MATKKKSNPPRRRLKSQKNKSRPTIGTKSSQFKQDQTAVFIYVTFPNLATAKKISTTLIHEKLIVCANFVPNMNALYIWKGQIEDGTETLGILKCSYKNRQALSQRISELHPYEVPCIAQIQLLDLNRKYAEWILNS